MIYHSSCDWWRNIILFDVLRIKELTTNPDIILWNSTYVNVTRVTHDFALIIIRVRLVEIDSLVRGTKVTLRILYTLASLSRLFTFPLYYCFIYICACSLRNSRRWVGKGRARGADWPVNHDIHRRLRDSFTTHLWVQKTWPADQAHHL